MNSDLDLCTTKLQDFCQFENKKSDYKNKHEKDQNKKNRGA